MIAEYNHVVTGANGYLGSNLIRYLLHQDAKVVALARCDNQSVVDAIENAACAGLWPLTATQLGNLKTRKYSLDQADLALNVSALPAKPVWLWHCAAYMSFQSTDLDRSLATNLEGTRHVCQWFEDNAPANSKFFYISTAYTCGHIEHDLSERLYPPEEIPAFQNPYEYSKRLAEWVVRDMHERSAHQYCILRPGQIIGRSDTGETTTHYGFYRLARLAVEISRRGIKSLKIWAEPDAHFHLVPIDSCVESMVCLSQLTAKNRAFSIRHILPSEPLPITDAMNCLSEITGVTLQIISPSQTPDVELNITERIVNRQLREVVGYVKRQYSFTSEQHTLNLSPPRVDREVMMKNLSYYVQHLVPRKERDAASQEPTGAIKSQEGATSCTKDTTGKGGIQQ